ncbi:uncharacterized protein LOC119987856 [Tripterygium wilfordii]|uniref:uncharacterized protein LOC119987856 n=1 Tax=Tripterygium wilfordii TaxID=458696 RepID=UPI0018F84CE5|nr:uncharacterized protein LOC119987856 [Tripterygium wilfordii]
MYRKPFTERVDRISLPRGFRPPDFSLFSGKHAQSFMEHIAYFIIQYGEVGSEDDYKLKLFGNSVTFITFYWYIKLPNNSIDTWTEMEETFYKQFYKEEPEVTEEDLSRITQFLRESIESFLTRFKEARLRCNFEILEGEVVALAMKGMLVQFRKKFDDLDFQDFYHLTIRFVRYEREVAVAEILSKKYYICKYIIKLEPPKQPATGLSKSVKFYAYDVSKIEKIFDCLLAYKIIKLPLGHIIPPPKEIQKKTYCKYHNSWSHFTNNCVAFRNKIQARIEREDFIVLEPAMGVDFDPFPPEMGAHMDSINIGHMPSDR